MIQLDRLTGKSLTGEEQQTLFARYPGAEIREARERQAGAFFAISTREGMKRLVLIKGTEIRSDNPGR